MKHINIVIIDGVERDMATLSAEERAKIVNELNRVAVGYKGLAEITQVYENTSTETDELENQSTKKLQELCSKKIFGMDIAKLGIDVGIGDIVGGRDYLTGMYSSRPVANIIYSVTNRVESKEYELEGESDNGNS